MYINRQMDKQDIVCPHNGKLRGYRKEVLVYHGRASKTLYYVKEVSHIGNMLYYSIAFI